MTVPGPPGFHPRPFRPARWAAGPHAQTLSARVLRSARVPDLTRVRWTTPDDDFLDLDLGPGTGPAAPVALVLHGLEGSSRRRYVLSACRALLARGVRPVALNFRGCSGSPNRQPRLYHSGETGDATLVLRRLREENPGVRLGAWGFSLGGNVLLKLLGEREDGGAGLLDAAVAMSVPYDLAAGVEALERTRTGRLYVAYFLRSLRRKVRAKLDLLQPHIDVSRALAAKTLSEFDDASTAPLHGFRGAEDYYDRCSSARYLGGVRVPSLLIHSLDDPFLPAESVPRRHMTGNGNFTTLLTERGGHVGFLEGSPFGPRFWGEDVGADFLAKALGA